MERIVLEVDDVTGMAYKSFTPESKKKFNQAVSMLLRKAINDSSKDSYKEMLDEIGKEAAANGLTEDILNDLLSADE